MSELDLDRVCSRVVWNEVDLKAIENLIELARLEDLEGLGWLKAKNFKHEDVSSQSFSYNNTGEVSVIARRSMVVSGLELLPSVVKVYGFNGHFEVTAKDGSSVHPGETLARLTGDASQILQLERVFLNFLQHLSGIATNTQRYIHQMGSTQTRLLDTRKTTPGYRILEKYAVACGGAWNHRIGLFDRVLIKDNHLAASSSTQGDRLKRAVESAKQKYPELLIEVEVDHLRQIQPVLDANADIIMLDNFSPATIVESLDLIGSDAFTESSGGISLETIQDYSNLGLNFISCGSLVHQSQWIDIAFDWKEN
jgi:nicotinate-nucleotide pyrophosphorylase (carboxylating)